jgi:hypothetical protein
MLLYLIKETFVIPQEKIDKIVSDKIEIRKLELKVATLFVKKNFLSIGQYHINAIFNSSTNNGSANSILFI